MESIFKWFSSSIAMMQLEKKKNETLDVMQKNTKVIFL